MKVGQIASQTGDTCPKFSVRWKNSKEAPPMPFEVILEQVESELGKPVGELFEYLQETPYASASIGQVHRARLHGGTDVIVKVQYPGVDESRSRPQKLRLALKLGGLLKMPKETVDQLMAEVVRLKEELDYENEARNLKLFHEFHNDQPWVIIPEVVDSHSTRRVQPGAGGGRIRQQMHRNTTPGNPQPDWPGFSRCGRSAVQFQCIHGDPHAGNFAYRPDGTIIMYDFGCVKKLKPIVEAYRKALIAALDEDYQALDQYLIDLGARVDSQPAVDEAYYAMWRDILIIPFLNDEPYDFAEADIQKRDAKTSTVFKCLDYFKPPVEYFHRPDDCGGITGC